MPATNSAVSYGSVTKTFHWLTVLLIFTAIPLGITANWIGIETSEQIARKALLFSLHKTVGVTAFFVALARIVWALTQVKPAGLHPERKAESFMAELVHWLLYGSLLIVPLSGWVHHASTTGFAPIWWPFGQNLPFVPKSEALAGVSAGLHVVFERVLVVSIALHIAGALKHHVIDKDDTLRRMLPGHTEAGTPHKAQNMAPLGAALVVWVAALGIGSSLGLYEKHASQLASAELEAVNSEWAVQDGTIAITISQFGSDVNGEFADWTSEISFTPSDVPGKHGKVRTVISIPSLTLGSVTDQAMGPDFFDAARHAQAVFEADLIFLQESYVAEGTLRIKDNDVPIRLPFDLTLEGETAMMKAQIDLNRLDFGIGASMPDESSLAFSVKVDIALTALRAAD